MSSISMAPSCRTRAAPSGEVRPPAPDGPPAQGSAGSRRPPTCAPSASTAVRPRRIAGTSGIAVTPPRASFTARVEASRRPDDWLSSLRTRRRSHGRMWHDFKAAPLGRGPDGGDFQTTGNLPCASGRRADPLASGWRRRASGRVRRRLAPCRATGPRAPFPRLPFAADWFLRRQLHAWKRRQ